MRSAADRWVKIPQLVISNEVPRQRQYDDTLPTVSVFFRLMTKRWADVCLEFVEFCASQRLLPAGSLQFCRSLQLVEPVSRIAPSRSPVFSFRVSQFCSIFVDFSLFNWFPSADITEFLSSVALDRTVLRSVQSSQNSFSVVPSVQLSLDQHQSSSSSTDSSSSLHFFETDVDATTYSLPPASQDLSAALADLHATLSEQIFEYQSGLSSKLHKIEQSVCDSLRDQADIFRNLSQGARQEARTLDDVQTIHFNDFRKHVLDQNASIFTGLADVRQEVQAVNAKVDIMASRLNSIQKDAEATKEALSHQLLEFQSSAQENHSVLHAQLSELVDYIHRGDADKKGESGSRGLQQPSNVQVSASAERTPTFAQRVEMAQRHIVHTVLDADANRALFERQDAADQRSAGSLVIPSADHSNDIVSLYTYLKDLATGFLSCDWFLFVVTGAVHSAVSRGNRHFMVDCGRQRQSGPRPDARLLRQPALEGLTRSARTDSPRQDLPEQFPVNGGGVFREEGAAALMLRYLCDPQWFRDTASHGPTTIAAPESQFRTCPSDHDSIGYPRMSASGESSTTMHRLLHASGSHPIPTPYDPKRVGKRVKVRRLSCRVSMTFRVMRTNQYNQDLGLIHSTNGNHLEIPNEGSSIDHQVTIYLHAQNITIFPTNETWYFASQILVSSLGDLVLILTAQSTRNMFRIHSDY
ncbi:hypothetical protein F511_27272 [Dorcoceras hygrometricum]|uniref:Uncharacterized protein n=1 Tax=Dorcoceras hygrometricum TaxID=472368 RepID=A0A2Z7B3Y3_9LAMI|nr:hypothetical protein F511_27272 [Dorcoceras hygrometricum]